MRVWHRWCHSCSLINLCTCTRLVMTECQWQHNVHVHVYIHIDNTSIFPFYFHVYSWFASCQREKQCLRMDIESPPRGNKWQNVMRLWHSLTDFSGDNYCSLSTYLCIIVAYFCIHFQSLKGEKNQYWKQSVIVQLSVPMLSLW